MIANRIDPVNRPGIRKLPASELSPDSDLAELLSTTHVGELTDGEIRFAPDCGRSYAQMLCFSRNIECAAMFLKGQIRIAGNENLISLNELREKEDVEIRIGDNCYFHRSD